MSSPQVGGVVRALRKGLGRTLADVAAASGLSVPFLSQIENGRATPSMRSLQAVAAALDTTAVAVLSAAQESTRVDIVRAAENVRDEGSTGTVRSLVRGDRQLHALEFAGTTEHEDREFTHANDEILYVVRGAARVWAGGVEYDVTAGDTLYWTAGIPHRWKALSPDTTVLLVAVNDRARVSIAPSSPRAPRRV